MSSIDLSICVFEHENKQKSGVNLYNYFKKILQVVFFLYFCHVIEELLLLFFDSTGVIVIPDMAKPSATLVCPRPYRYY